MMTLHWTCTGTSAVFSQGSESVVKDQHSLLVTNTLFLIPVSLPGWSPCSCLLGLTQPSIVATPFVEEGPLIFTHWELLLLRSKPLVTGRLWYSQDISTFHWRIGGDLSSSWLMQFQVLVFTDLLSVSCSIEEIILWSFFNPQLYLLFFVKCIIWVSGSYSEATVTKPHSSSPCSSTTFPILYCRIFNQNSNFQQDNFWVLGPFLAVLRK